MTTSVNFAPEAERDLQDIYDAIAERASPGIALAYVLRVEEACGALAHFPQRGTRRDELRPGLRTMGLERRITIAFHVGADAVTIDRVLYGGRDLNRALGAP